MHEVVTSMLYLHCMVLLWYSTSRLIYLRTLSSLLTVDNSCIISVLWLVFFRMAGGCFCCCFIKNTYVGHHLVLPSDPFEQGFTLLAYYNVSILSLCVVLQLLIVQEKKNLVVHWTTTSQR